MAEVTTYSFQEGLLDTVLGAMRPIEVVDDRGTVAGRIVRGELDGCERSGTFRYEPAGGAPTEVGVRRMTARTVLGRLLRPTYVVTHGEERWELKDLPGENILYFALAGEVAGLRLDAREDWDGSIEVVAREPGDRSKRGARRVCRFNSGDLLVRTAVRVDEALLGRLCDAPDPRGTALFGVLVLLPFLHRVYRQESSLIDELFFG